MKRFIMAIVCLMTMVMSVNAQYRIDDEHKSEAYEIDENIYCKFKNMDKGKFALLVHGGYTNYNFDRHGAWFYEIDNNEIMDFILFLKKIETTLKRYEDIALNNNVHYFEKELDISYAANIIYLEDFSYYNSFSIKKESIPCILKSVFHLSNDESSIEITPKKFISYLEKKDYIKINCIARRFPSHKLEILIKQLKNIEEKVLFKYNALVQIKKEKQKRHEAELREKKRIEDLFN